MIIRHEINILSGVLPPAVYTSGTPEKFFLDLSVYSGTLTAYLEVNCSAISIITAVRLYNFNTSTVVSPTASVQSTGLTTPPPIAIDITTLPAATYGLWVSDSSTMKSVKLIILQDTGTGSLTKSQSQIEIGNRELSKTNTAALPLTAPKYWRYNAANWTNTIFSAEVTWQYTGTGTGTIRLQESSADLAAPTWTDKLTIINAGIAATPAHFRGNSFTPIDGRMYRLTTQNSSSMGALSIFNSKIIVQQEQNIGDALEQSHLTNENAVYQSNMGRFSAQSFPCKAGYITIASLRISNNLINGQFRYALYESIDSPSFPGSDIGSGPTLSVTAWENCSNIGAQGSYRRNFLIPYFNTVVGKKYVVAIEFQDVTTGTMDTFATTAINNYTLGNYSANFGGLATPNWQPSSGNDINFEIFVNQTLLTKLEEQYLIANTTLAAGTALQNFISKWDSAEWSGVNNTYAHAVDSSASNTSVIDLRTVGGTQLVGSIVNKPNNQGISFGNPLDYAYDDGAFGGYIYTDRPYLGQSFSSGGGGALSKVKAYMYISNGIPTGIVEARLYSHTGTFGAAASTVNTLLATSTNSINVSNIGASSRAYEFTFNSYILTPSTSYFIVFAIVGGTSDVLNRVEIRYLVTANHAGTSIFFSTTGWNSDTGNDVVFFIYTTTNLDYLIMPSNQNLDVRATTNSGNIYASRIITSVVVAPPSSIGFAYSFCVMM